MWNPFKTQPTEEVIKPEYQCSCHQKYKDEFWKIPLDECRRPDKVCNYKVVQWTRRIDRRPF